MLLLLLVKRFAIKGREVFFPMAITPMGKITVIGILARHATDSLAQVLEGDQ